MPRGGKRPNAGRKRTKSQVIAGTAAVSLISADPANRAKSKGRFQPGQSGNPTGRPKEDAQVKAEARKHTKAAITRLAEWMKSDNARASVSASVALLDRAWGRPSQAITGAGGGPVIVQASDADSRL